MGEQHFGDARVLRDHRIGRSEGRQGAKGYVPEIADRGSDDMQSGFDRLRFGAQAKRDETAVAVPPGSGGFRSGNFRTCHAFGKEADLFFMQNAPQRESKALFCPQNWAQ
jgi:hypothetical protein